MRTCRQKHPYCHNTQYHTASPSFRKTVLGGSGYFPPYQNQIHNRVPIHRTTYAGAEGRRPGGVDTVDGCRRPAP